MEKCTVLHLRKYMYLRTYHFQKCYPLVHAQLASESPIVASRRVPLRGPSSYLLFTLAGPSNILAGLPGGLPGAHVFSVALHAYNGFEHEHVQLALGRLPASPACGPRRGRRRLGCRAVD